MGPEGQLTTFINEMDYVIPMQKIVRSFENDQAAKQPTHECKECSQKKIYQSKITPLDAYVHKTIQMCSR